MNPNSPDALSVGAEAGYRLWIHQKLKKRVKDMLKKEGIAAFTVDAVPGRKYETINFDNLSEYALSSEGGRSYRGTRR